MARVVKSSRLFENRFLEAATHVHPITPLVIWVPAISYLFYESIGNFTLLSLFSLAMAGLFIWTLTEYSFHKYLFHFRAKSKIGKYLVFLIHGIHHDEPDDATRLVMPPVPAIVFASLFFFSFRFFFGADAGNITFCFFIIGYLCYDYIHYAIHHFACKGRALKFLKRHHMLHHHLMDNGNFGVSSPLWDYAFGTFRDRVDKAAH